MTEAGLGNALVTGAGRGIGRAIALALAKKGFNLLVNDLAQSAELDETVALIRRERREAVAVRGDIADIAGHEALVETAWNAFGGLHCLVNNAGISVAKRDDILTVTPESFDRLHQVNLRGPFFLTQTIAKRMLVAPEDRFRSIITVSSINVGFVAVDRAEYCLSKTALAMMSQLYAVRLASAGINCYEVQPGVIRTDMTAVVRERYDRLFESGVAPIARWGEADDVGSAIAMLASGALAYTTGETLRVDGGLAIRRL
jgi:NAD(P)-dependent dehydrogenase (short-subunit alcohol dehydrogenase family)